MNTLKQPLNTKREDEQVWNLLEKKQERSVYEWIMSAQANVNTVCERNALTLLMKCAQKGYTKCVKALLERGVNAKIRCPYGGTALMSAAWGGKARCVKILMPHSEVMAIDSRGINALMFAVHSGNKEAVRLLVKQSDILHQDKQGVNALMMACGAGQVENIDILLEHMPVESIRNIDQVKDKSGRTVWEWSERCISAPEGYIKKYLKSSIEARLLAQSMQECLREDMPKKKHNDRVQGNVEVLGQRARVHRLKGL